MYRVTIISPSLTKDAGEKINVCQSLFPVKPTEQQIRRTVAFTHFLDTIGVPHSQWCETVA